VGRTERTVFFAVAAIIVAGAMVLRMVITDRAAVFAAENDRLAAATRVLSERTRDVAQVRGLIADFLARKQVMEGVADASSPAAEVLAALSRLPRSVVFAGASFDGLRVVANGTAENERAANDMLAAVRAAPHVRGARLVSLDATHERGRFGADARAFQLDLELKP